MLGETSNRVLLAGVAVSLLLHLSGALAWYAVGATPGASENFERPEVHDPSKPPDHRIELGDPESRTVSMTWLGFDEYKKHIATPSQVDQPQLTMDPSGELSGASGSISQASAAMAEAASAARAEAARAMAQVAAGLQAMGSWAKVLPEGQEQADQVSPGQAQTPPTEAQTQAAAKEQQTPDEKVAQETEAKQAQAQQTKPAEPTPMTEKVAASKAGAGGKGATGDATGRRTVEGRSGRQDDRESDATSIERAKLGDPGQPLAARGLRIRTVRPVFSHYTSIVANPRSPVVRIHFDSTGRARLVDLIQSSGNPDIDRPVLDAVYRWTASGESLKELAGSETVSVDVRILL